jgi:putative hydrolase of the HAD superfamily
MVEAGTVNLVLVDFDDTLVDTGPRFQNARRALFGLLEKLGFDPEHARRLHHDVIDPVMLERHGLGPQRLRHSFRATYEELCAAAGSPVSPEELTRCEELGIAVAGAPPVLSGALDALRRLTARHHTVLYTQAGNAEYQLECVRACGVLDIVPVERVHICARKTADAFRATIAAFGVSDPATVWMIGNSMRSDINPALEAGANAILVEVEDPWEFDLVDPVSHRFLRATSFAEAANYLLTE